MSCPFNDEQLAQLKAFVDVCKQQPQILQNPKLSFFKDYLVSLGVTLPFAPFGKKNYTASGDANPKRKPMEETGYASSDAESEIESDVELDMEGVIEGIPLDGDQDMGDPDKEPTDEEVDQSDEKRSKAMMAFSEQKYDEAIALYTKAIQLNPQGALLFAKRGQVYLKQNKLAACIKDCTRALELNCDSAAAYKFRGRAYRLLGKFEEASHDLCESLKIDYDDQANEWLAEVRPNAEKLRQHKLSVQRKKEEKEHREKLRKARRAQEARTKARAEAEADGAAPDLGDLGDLGGFGGFGNIPNEYANIFSDPELLAALQDPEVSQMIYDISASPVNYMKYQGNPKFAKILEMFQKKTGKDGSKPPGDFAGFGGAGGPPTGPKPGDDDVGLD